MKKLKIVVPALLLFVALVGIVYALTPPPPPPPTVPQTIGVYDTSIDWLQTNATDESACRNCHQSTGTNVSGGTNLTGYNNTIGGVDTRHHRLVQLGIMNPCTNVSFGCQNCHPSAPGVGNGVVLDHSCKDCHNGTPWWGNSIGGNVCNVPRPHHLNTSNDTANIGTPAMNRTCNFCHGNVVDNYNDQHYIPSYDTSFMITPYATYKITNFSQPNPFPVYNGEGQLVPDKTWGGCESCHLSNTNVTGQGPDPFPWPIGSNHANHHKEILGFLRFEGRSPYQNLSTDFLNGSSHITNTCAVCHVIDVNNVSGHGNTFPLLLNLTNPNDGEILNPAIEVRNSSIEQQDLALGAIESGTVNVTFNGTGCEKCHSVMSLHNIQFNYSQNGPQGLGHINNNTDCSGCHNSWLPADTWTPGPLVPTITGITPATLPAGNATTLTITGLNFINPDGNYTSVVTVNGVSYTPSSETATQIVANIPALTAGTYLLQILKNGDTLSNLVPVTVVLNPSIRSAIFTPGKNGPGTLTITGAGFGTKPTTNAQYYISASHNGTQIIASSVAIWKDTQIVAKITEVNSGDQVTVLTTISGEAISNIK